MTVRIVVLTGLDEEPVAVARERLAGTGLPTLDYRRDGQDRLVRSFGDGRGGIDSAALHCGQRCVPCTVLTDLAHVLGEYSAASWAAGLLVVLPPAVPGWVVLDALRSLHPVVQERIELGSLITALDPVTLPTILRTAEPLSSRGIRIGHGDQACGGFLIEELLFSDCYVLVGSPGSTADFVLGLELARQIAPHGWATMLGTGPAILPPPDPDRTGYDPVEVGWRTSPGSVAVAHDDGRGRIRTHLAHTRRPLHPVRLKRALGAIIKDCSWSRGRAWVSSVPDRKVAWTSIGPQLSLCNGGPWLADRPERSSGTMDTEGILNWDPELGDRGCWLAFTGENLRPTRIDALLAQCELTDEEYWRGPESWRRLPDPLHLIESFGHAHPATLDLRS